LIIFDYGGVNYTDYLPLSTWPSTVGSVAEEVVEDEDDSSSSSSTPTIQKGVVDNKIFIGELKYGYLGRFEVGNENHRIYLRGIDRENGVANFDVYSEKQSVEVRVGEEKEIDLDGDGVNDVLLKLDSIDEDRVAVDLELGEIEKVVAEEEFITGNVVKGEVAEEVEAEEESLLWLRILTILIIVGIIGYLFWKKKNNR